MGVAELILVMRGGPPPEVGPRGRQRSGEIRFRSQVRSRASICWARPSFDDISRSTRSRGGVQVACTDAYVNLIVVHGSCSQPIVDPVRTARVRAAIRVRCSAPGSNPFQRHQQAPSMRHCGCMSTAYHVQGWPGRTGLGWSAVLTFRRSSAPSARSAKPSRRRRATRFSRSSPRRQGRPEPFIGAALAYWSDYPEEVNDFLHPGAHRGRTGTGGMGTAAGMLRFERGTRRRARRVAPRRMFSPAIATDLAAAASTAVRSLQILSCALCRTWRSSRRRRPRAGFL